MPNCGSDPMADLLLGKVNTLQICHGISSAIDIDSPQTEVPPRPAASRYLGLPSYSGLVRPREPRILCIFHCWVIIVTWPTYIPLDLEIRAFAILSFSFWSMITSPDLSFNWY